MSTWYKTRWHGSSMALVETIEIIKTTSASVWVDDRRKSKRGEYENFFETQDEAVQFILDAQRGKIEYYRAQIASHEAVIMRFGATSVRPTEEKL